MLRVLLRKGLADLRSRGTQFALVFLVVAATAGMLTMAVSIQRSIRGSYQRALDHAHGAHVWFGLVNPDVSKEIAGRPGVKEASRVFEQVRGTLLAAGEPDDVVYVGIGDAPEGISPAYLVQGRWLRGDTEEIVISQDLARHSGIEVGDTVAAASANASVNLQVVGIVVDTSSAPYPWWKPAFVFVAKATATTLAGGPLAGLSGEELAKRRADYAFGVRLANPEAAEIFASDMRRRFPREVDHTRTWLSIRDAVVETNEGPGIVMRMFGIFGLLVAGLMLAGAITGHVLGQAREIGVLKATGFSPWHIALLFLGEQLALAVGATLVGATAGMVAAPLVLDSFSSLLYAAAPLEFAPWLLGLAVLGVGLFTVGFTLIPALRAGRTSTVEAISGRHRRSPSLPSHLANVARWLSLPTVVVIGLKDVFARRARAWLTVGAVAVAIATAMFTFMLQDMFTRADNDPVSMGGWPFQLQVERLPEFRTRQAATGQFTAGAADPISHQDLVAVIESHEEAQAYLTTWTAPSRLEGQAEWITTFIVRGRIEDFGFRVTRGRMFSGRNEAVIGLGLADAFGYKVGDDVILLLPLGEERFADVPLRIVGEFVSAANDGMNLMFDVETLQDVEVGNLVVDDFGSINLKLAPGIAPGDFAESLMRETGYRVFAKNLVAEFDRARADDRQLMPLFVTLSGGLMALAAVNLLISLAFSVSERVRDFGILKTVGFTPFQIVLTVATGAGVLSILGVAIGAPLGYLFMTEVMMRLADVRGMPDDFFRAPGLLWQALLVVIAVAIAFLGSALPAKRAADTAVSQALRFE